MSDDLRNSFKYKRLTQLIRELPEQRKEKLAEMVELEALTKEVYSPDELAKFLDIHPATVRRWLQAGEIKGKQIRRKWFIPKEEVFRILNAEG